LAGFTFGTLFVFVIASIVVILIVATIILGVFFVVFAAVIVFFVVRFDFSPFSRSLLLRSAFRTWLSGATAWNRQSLVATLATKAFSNRRIGHFVFATTVAMHFRHLIGPYQYEIIDDDARSEETQVNESTK
jgi:hypothetical protein